MRKLATLAALTIVGLIGLVPIAATPAAAAGTLDVTIDGVTPPEVATVITGHYMTLTATVSAPVPPDATVIDWDTDGGTPPSSDTTCTTTAGACSITINEGGPLIRAWMEDGPPALPCGTPALPQADCDSTEPQDETTMSGGQTPEPDDTDVVSMEWKDGSLDVEPEAPSAAPTTALTGVTAKVVSTETTPVPLIANVDAEVISGPNNTPGPAPATVDAQCDTAPATGECSLSYIGSATSGVDVLQAWVDRNDDKPAETGPPAVPAGGDETSGSGFEGDATEGTDEATTPGAVAETPNKDITDVIDVNWTGTQTLDISPESTTKTTNTAATFTASVSTPGGTGQSGVKVAAAIDAGGPNVSKTITACTTGANGTCSLTYTGTAVGVDKVRAAIDSDQNNLPNEADATEGVTGSGTEAGGTVEPDTTDVVQVTWTAATPTPTPDPGDSAACEEAKKKLKKAKKALKKAKKTGDDDKIAKAKKKVKRAKNRKAAACSGA
jgi:hypothetical protein